MAALTVVTGFVPALAGAEADVTLSVGDAAPKLQTGKWVQGDPVSEFARNKAYIVEYWATWCGPCRVSIPHLNEIHEKFKEKGLVVIGQDVWERDESLVAPFVKKMGSNMTYRVALDSKKDSEDKGRMAETWMEAAGQNGIPSAFVVDKAGRIAWIGHPMELKDGLIEDVLANKHDLKKAAAEYTAKRERDIKMRGYYQAYGEAMNKKDWTKAEAALADMEKALPKDDHDTVGSMRFQMLLAKKDVPAAEKLARQLSDAYPAEGMLQNEIAWSLMTHKAIAKPNVELADVAATRANEITKGKDPSILDTLARAKFLKGEKEKAIELQTKAVSLSEGKSKESLTRTLDAYREGNLPKTGGGN